MLPVKLHSTHLTTKLATVTWHELLPRLDDGLSEIDGLLILARLAEIVHRHPYACLLQRHRQKKKKFKVDSRTES